MKNLRFLFSLSLVALGVLPVLVTAAQEPAPPAPPAAAPAAEPGAPDAAVTEAPLRRIDEVPPGKSAPRGKTTRPRGSRGGEQSAPFGNHQVAADRQVREAVSIFGSLTVEGKVDSDAVSVMGNTTVAPGAKVGGAAVAVLGKLVSKGSIRREAVSVLGGVEIDGPVGGEAVSVLGNMVLGPLAIIEGDIVIIGGQLTRHPDAIVRGNQVHVPLPGLTDGLEWLTTWVKRCVFFGRPLAFGPHLGWAWTVAFAFLAFYLLVALLFSRGIERCVETVETRPGMSVLASILTLLLTPVAVVLLAITVVGALLIPFLSAALFFAALFGKAVMFAWIGRRITRLFGGGRLSHPFFAVLIGGLLVMLLYTIWGSFLLYKLLSWLGLGVVVYTIALAMTRDKPVVAAAGTGVGGIPPAAPGVALGVAAAPSVPLSAGTAAFAQGSPEDSAASAGSVAGAEAVPPALGALPEPPPPPPPPAPPLPPGVVVSAATLPRAGFFLRLAALALDGFLIGMVFMSISHMMPRFLQFHDGPGGVLIALAIYGALMWKHKGTTIGGIICGLKVVRVDGRDVDWATAIVRALSCFLSLVVAGLGFIWVAFDGERQSWHDKIAGTTVVRVPKGVSLL